MIIRSIAQYKDFYSSALPFPHLVCPSFMDDYNASEIAREIKEFEDFDGKTNAYFSRGQKWCSTWGKFPPTVFEFIQHCNSQSFVSQLETLTGEKALHSDRFLEGAGIMRVRQGGFLKVHADFNWHKRLQMYRRLNLLVYFNTFWFTHWGGALELWSKDMKEKVQEIYPYLNTAVIFTTDDDSLHGYPDPVQCPKGVTRNAIGLYYYSPIKPKNWDRPRIGTDYRWRPGKDKKAMVGKLLSKFHR